MASPDISVVIPTLARTTALENCLASLAAQEFTNFEVIIVSLKIEACKYLLDKFQDLSILLVSQQEAGLVSARNLGLAHARGRIVAFIDDDVTVSSCWTREILQTFNRLNEAGGVSGPTIIPERLLDNRDILMFQEKKRKDLFWKIIGSAYNHLILESKPQAVGKIFRSGAFSIGANYRDCTKFTSEQEVEYLEACNMSFRRDTLQEVGGFSCEYKGVGDWSEPDLAFKVRKLGYKLFFNPKAALEHNLSQAGVFTERGKDSYQRARNFLHFYFKWIKPNNPDKFLRFGANLWFLNLYWCYKFIQTGRAEWLGGILALRYILDRKSDV